MLCSRLEDNPEIDIQTGQDDTWRVSSGSASVLGLCRTSMATPPTTAYLMLGERCSGNCAFCTQARSSTSSQAALSRVTWPKYPVHETVQAIATAYTQGSLRRACFQVTVSPGHLDLTRQAVRYLSQSCDIPICASVAARSLADVASLLGAGADKVTLALDAATPEVHRRTKSGSWQGTLDLLREAASAFPGHISTHLIVGLGETEHEMCTILQQLHAWGVGIGLFAFTPIAGTALAACPPPPLISYRRLQAASWLIVHDLIDKPFTYRPDGRILSLGLSAATLSRMLNDGSAFRTSGCPDCNRPYYNERPGGPMYNYPHPLSPEQAQAELEALFATLDIEDA